MMAMSVVQYYLQFGPEWIILITSEWITMKLNNSQDPKRTLLTLDQCLNECFYFVEENPISC